MTKHADLKNPGDGDSGTPSDSAFLMVPVLFLTFIFFMNFLGRIILAPLMPWIEEDLGLSHAAAGSLFLLLSVGYFMALLGSGHISSILCHRKTIVLSATSLGAGLATLTFSNGLWGLRAGMFLTGITAGLYLPSAIATLTDVTSTRHWGRVISIHELAPNTAFLMAPLLADLMVPQLSWQGLLAILAACTVAAGLGFAVFVRAGEFPGQAPDFKSTSAFISKPAFWIMVFIFAMGITGTLGIYNMLPLYLVAEKGFTPEKGNAILALSRVSTLGTALLGGIAADRFGARATMVTVLLVTGLITILLGIAPQSMISLLVFLQPTLAVAFFPSGFAMLSSLAPPKARNLAVSLTVPLSFVAGGGAIPALIGIMGDSGHLGIGISMAGGLILLASFFLFFIKEPRRR